jgi:hypothetical protein
LKSRNSRNFRAGSSSDENRGTETETGRVKAKEDSSFRVPGFGILPAAIGLLGVYAVKKK